MVDPRFSSDGRERVRGRLDGDREDGALPLRCRDRRKIPCDGSGRRFVVRGLRGVPRRGRHLLLPARQRRECPPSREAESRGRCGDGGSTEDRTRSRSRSPSVRMARPWPLSTDTRRMRAPRGSSGSCRRPAGTPARSTVSLPPRTLRSARSSAPTAGTSSYRTRRLHWRIPTVTLFRLPVEGGEPQDLGLKMIELPQPLRAPRRGADPLLLPRRRGDRALRSGSSRISCRWRSPELNGMRRWRRDGSIVPESASSSKGGES